MGFTRSSIVRRVFYLEPREGEVSIEHLCLEAIKELRGRITLQDQEWVSKFRKSLFSDLRDYDSSHTRNGGLNTFQFLEKPSLRVSWLIYDPMDRRRRLKLLKRSFALEWIESLSDDRHYEFLGGLLMRRLGASDVYVTPKGNEFGIDFVACVPAFSRSDLFISGSRGVRIVGQCKFYQSAMAREKVQSFSDCMNSIRSNKHELLSILPAWFRNHPAPLVGCFLAHSGYQDGARVAAEQNGYILFDSRAASEILVTAAKLDKIATKADLHKLLWGELQRLAS